MKKNGFTLIELIATITLIGLIGVVVSTNILKLINTQRDNKETEFHELLEETACAYVGLSTVKECDSGCVLSGEELINAGMIDEVIYNYQVKDYNVKVTFDSGQKKCTVEE